MKVSFITPAYNAGSTLRGSIESFLNQKSSHVLEYIIVDDGSTDDTLSVAKDFEKCQNVKVISKKNGGEASALNEGLNLATGDYIVLAEADVEFEKDWLEKVLVEFKDPEVMGVGGRLITHPKDNWIARIHGYEIEYKFEGKKRITKHITSANAIYRKEVFKKFGRFNEKLINASLDADLNQRIVRQGYKLVYRKDVVAYHHYKSSFKEYLKRQYSYARYRPHLSGELYEKERTFGLQSILFSCFLLSLILFIISVFLFFQLTWIFFYLLLVLFLILILLQIPITIKVIKNRNDNIFLLFPIISILRLWIWVVGYSIGFLKKGIGKY